MLRVTTEWTGTQPGTPYYTNLMFGGTTGGEADAASAAVLTLWQTLDTDITNRLTWTILPEAEFVDPATGNVTGIEPIPGGTAPGASGLDPLPAFTQALLRWRTGLFVAGREVRGRTFVPGPTEAMNTLGIPTATYLNFLTATANTFLVDAGTAGDFGVWSPTRGLFAAAASVSAWTQWSTLRSRRD